MYQAIEPNTDILMTAELYIQKYANAQLNNNNYQPPKMICPHCGNSDITLAARSSLVKVPYFKHPKDSGFCPSQENRNGVYRGHQIKNPDANNARILKKHFYENWNYYFQKLKCLVPYLRKEEFTGLIDIANEERIWEYQNVKYHHIPYLLVTLADFPAQKPNLYHKLEYCRKFYFRYWFVSKADNYEKIIESINKTSLCRASYELKGKETKPKPEKLQKFSNFEITNDLMNQDVTRIHDSVTQWMDKYFKIKHW